MFTRILSNPVLALVALSGAISDRIYNSDIPVIPPEDEKRNDFQRVYGLARENKKAELVRLVADEGVCIDVRRGWHTPASLLAEQKQYAAVNLLRDEFFANIDYIAMGFAMSGDLTEVKFYQEEFAASLQACALGFAAVGNNPEVEKAKKIGVDKNYIALGYAYANNAIEIKAAEDAGASSAAILMGRIIAGQYANDHIHDVSVTANVDLKLVAYATALAGRHDKLKDRSFSYDITEAYAKAGLSYKLPRCISLTKRVYTMADFDDFSLMLNKGENRSAAFGHATGGHHAHVDKLINFFYNDGLSENEREMWYASMARGYIESRAFINEKVGVRTLVAILQLSSSPAEIISAVQAKLHEGIDRWVKRAKMLVSLMRIHSLTYEQASAISSPEFEGLVYYNKILDIPAGITEIMITFVAPMSEPITLYALKIPAVQEAIRNFEKARSSRVGLFSGSNTAKTMMDDLLKKEQTPQARYQLAKQCLAKKDTDDELAFGQELRKVML